jgi:hypothetical protein
MYSVYAAPWGQPKAAIDFTTPIATTSTAPVILQGIRGLQLSGDRYLCIRKTVNGIEEKNFNVIHFILDGNGEWIGNYPLAPYHLSAEVIEGNRVELTWEYQVGSVTPSGFYIFAGVGTVNYTTPLKTFAYRGGIQTETLPSISADTIYGVRAFHGGNVEQNTTTVLVPAPATPVNISGVTTATTWRDQ